MALNSLVITIFKGGESKQGMINIKSNKRTLTLALKHTFSLHVERRIETQQDSRIKRRH